MWDNPTSGLLAAPAGMGALVAAQVVPCPVTSSPCSTPDASV
jgi:hypothetical protein